MTSQPTHLESASEEVGGGSSQANKSVEMTRWPCAEKRLTTLRRSFREVVPIGTEVNTRVSSLVIAATVAVLLLFAGGSLAAALLGSLVLVGPAVIFAVLAGVLVLAAIPGIQVRFSCKFCSFGVETRCGCDSAENSVAKQV
jgi:hypothetical protein